MPEVHGVSKSLDPNIQPEKQNVKPLNSNEISQERPCIGQGRTGMRRRPPPINQTITQTSELSKKISEAPKIEPRPYQPNSTTPMQSITNSNDEVTHRRPMLRDILFYPDPNYRPPPKPIRTPMPGSSPSTEITDINPEINIDLEENSPFQEGVTSEIYQRPHRSFSKNLKS